MIKTDRDIPEISQHNTDLNYGDVPIPKTLLTLKQSTQRLTIELIDPSKLSMEDIRKVHIMANDVWAVGTGEGMRCNNCHKTYSKSDIFNSDKFPHLKVSLEDFHMTFLELQGLYIHKSLECPDCNKGNLEEILGEDHIACLVNKYKRSVGAFLVVLKDQNNDFYGFAEGYVDTFESIYQNDFNRYFQEIGIDPIKERITNILGEIPQEMLIISGVGIRNLPEFSGPMKMNNTFRLLSNLFQMISEKDQMYPSIMLLDKNHPFMHHIFSKRDGMSLELEKFVDIGKITNLSNTYDPDIMIFADSAKSFDYNEYKSANAFFRKHGMPIKKNLY